MDDDDDDDDDARLGISRVRYEPSDRPMPAEREPKRAPEHTRQRVCCDAGADYSLVRAALASGNCAALAPFCARATVPTTVLYGAGR